MQDSVMRAGTDAGTKLQHVLMVSRQGRPKFETNSKFKYPMTKTRPSRFEHLNFCH